MPRVRLIAALLMLCAVAAPAGAAGPAKPRLTLEESPHNPLSGKLPPEVTSMAFSHDGRWLVASYFVPALNRPGTDWDSWVTEWDLETGLRITVPTGHGPVAISPDSRTLAMNVYTRGDDLMRPKLLLALWHLGETEPFQRLLPAEGLKDSVDIEFHPDGWLLALALDGSFLAWGPDWAKPATGPSHLNTWPYGPAELTVAPMIHIGAAPNAEIMAVAPVQGHALMHSNMRGEIRFDHWAIKKVPMPWASRGLRGIKHFALPPGELRWAALSGNGTLTLIDSKPSPDPAERPIERVLPAGGGAAAFSADATRVAAADVRGIVRIWDVATGRLVRTLRLDDRPTDTVFVAAVQCSSVFGDPEANRKALAAYVSQAAGAGAQIVVLPETAVTGYLTPDLKRTWQVDKHPLSEGLEGADPAAAAETVPGPSTEFFARLANHYGLYLTVPLLEVDRRTGRYYNTVVLLGPDGRTLIHYRKRNPLMWAEQGWVTAGDLGSPVVDTPFGRLGVLICFDIHEQAAVVAERKIDTLLYSIAWVEDEGSLWFSKMLPDIARERNFIIVAANWTVPPGAKPKWFGYGQSCVIGQNGTVLSRMKKATEEGLVFAEIPCGRQEAGGMATPKRSP